MAPIRNCQQWWPYWQAVVVTWLSSTWSNYLDAACLNVLHPALATLMQRQTWNVAIKSIRSWPMVSRSSLCACHLNTRERLPNLWPRLVHQMCGQVLNVLVIMARPRSHRTSNKCTETGSPYILSTQVLLRHLLKASLNYPPQTGEFIGARSGVSPAKTSLSPTWLLSWLERHHCSTLDNFIGCICVCSGYIDLLYIINAEGCLHSWDWINSRGMNIPTHQFQRPLDREVFENQNKNMWQ